MMKSVLLLSAAIVAVSAQMQGMSGMGGMSGMNFNLSTPQGIQGFLNMENIDPNSLVTSNCIPNGNTCSTSGGRPCCFSPVMTCQSVSGRGNRCMVMPAHREHIPMIVQILRTFGVTTQNPIQ